MADTQKDHSGRHRSAIIPENIQNFRERLEEPLENQHVVSHKKLVFREHQFCGSAMMTLKRTLRSETIFGI